MPTDLPVKKILSTASSSEGTLAFLVAVVLMLAITTAMVMHQQDDESANENTAAQTKTF